MVVGHIGGDGEEEGEGLPVAYPDCSYHQVRLVLHPEVFVDVTQLLYVLFNADLTLQDLLLQPVLSAPHTALLFEKGWVRPLNLYLDELL